MQHSNMLLLLITFYFFIVALKTFASVDIRRGLPVWSQNLFWGTKSKAFDCNNGLDASDINAIIFDNYYREITS